MSTAAVEKTSFRDHPIWVALERYAIGPPEASLSFTSRLARENGWSQGEAERVVTEYKRFCFLAATQGHVVTPSDAVDQAWHLHLTYTRDYWERFCPEILGRALHHDPTSGGAAQGHHFFDCYARTLKSYETVFGETAPADLWPKASRRLIEDPRARRVHPRDGFILSRRRAVLILVFLFLVLILSIFWR